MKHVSVNYLFVELIITGQNLSHHFSESHSRSFCSICSWGAWPCKQLKVLSLHEPGQGSPTSLPALGCTFCCATCSLGCLLGNHVWNKI